MNQTAPHGEKATATRDAILREAEHLFRSIGYQKTTVADIARALRMSPANIYRFFPSKAAINEAIAAQLLTGLIAQAKAIVAAPGPAPERLRRLFAMTQQQTVALFFNEKRMHDMVAVAMEEHWDVIEVFIEQFDQVLGQLVADGQALGEFAAELDPVATGHLIHASILVFAHPTLVQECGGEKLEETAAGMAEFVLRALRPG
jgi:AcrR family transcriptional regulator